LKTNELLDLLLDAVQINRGCDSLQRDFVANPIFPQNVAFGVPAAKPGSFIVEVELVLKMHMERESQFKDLYGFSFDELFRPHKIVAATC
jgi:hypothetical protein